MAWEEPKTNWQASDVVTANDFNRIEGNIQELQNTKETPAGAQAKVDAHESKTSTHGATSAATANRIIIRDSAGRAKVAAPSASDDIARKAEVDAVQANLTSHMNNKNNPHSVTAAQVGAAPASHVGSGGSAHALATTSAHGFMSSTDKSKLNSIIVTPHYQQFTTSGTWTKPSGINWVFVEVFGAGGGGGAGTTGDSNVAGGGGGGGGALSYALIPASVLSSTVSVVIGAGGAGGNSVNRLGSDGGSSSFAFVEAGGGIGTTSGSGGAGGSISLPDLGLNGCQGGTGWSVENKAGDSGVFGAGGGGGGSIDPTGIVRGAGVGGSSSFLGTSGGNGGTASKTGNGGKGGNGGLGCGGGGGGAALTGYTPGDGGNGGNGRVRVWAW